MKKADLCGFVDERNVEPVYSSCTMFRSDICQHGRVKILREMLDVLVQFRLDITKLVIM